jgi:hypothetical protein
MTSANVTDYRIEDLSGKQMGTHSQHHYCKTHWGDLLKFTPPENYMITPHGLDEEEESWEDEPMNLAVFLEQLRRGRAQFNTMDDILKKSRL